MTTATAMKTTAASSLGLLCMLTLLSVPAVDCAHQHKVIDVEFRVGEGSTRFSLDCFVKFSEIKIVFSELLQCFSFVTF
ncbi:Protein of unknown function [Gryllus bimaculatus]|nr:Protein of unknown function [Gryllus bimaculatus]